MIVPPRESFIAADGASHMFIAETEPKAHWVRLARGRGDPD